MGNFPFGQEDIYISDHKIKVARVGWSCGGCLIERYINGGVQGRLSFFFSIVRYASTHLRKPAPRGMASQHLRTFERGLYQCSKPGRSECSDLPKSEDYTLCNPAGRQLEWMVYYI